MKKHEAENIILKHLKKLSSDQKSSLYLTDFNTGDLWEDYYISEHDLLNYLKKFGILKLEEYRKIYKKEAAQLASENNYDESIKFMEVLRNYEDEQDDLLVVKYRFSYDLYSLRAEDLMHLVKYELNK